MRVECFADAGSFLRATEPFLLQNEAGNNLTLSLARALIQNPHAAHAPLIAACFDPSTGSACGTLIWIPSRQAVLSAGHNQSGAVLASLLLKHAAEHRMNLPGVLAPAETGEPFCRTVMLSSGLSTQLATEQIIMRRAWDGLEKISPLPPRPLPPGRLRQAWLEDLPRLRAWALEMVREGGLDEAPRDTLETTRNAILARQLYVWDDGGPVAMAGFSGLTPNGARVNSVYVPPPRRRHRYATAIVWQLSERLHQSGKKFVCLFADRSSDGPLALYRRLGFEAVGDCNEYKFNLFNRETSGRHESQPDTGLDDAPDAPLPLVSATTTVTPGETDARAGIES